jgi:sporulation protein YlmC with PRC-barrel domain
MRLTFFALPFLFAAHVAGAQSVPDAAAITEGAASLAAELAGTAADHVLIADMLGAEVIGVDGTPIGTVEDFAALPGGNLVAAVVVRDGGGRIALPWDAVKTGVAAGEAIELPMTEAELDGAGTLRDLTAALGL